MENEQKEQRKLIDSLCKQNEQLMALIQAGALPQAPLCNTPQNFEAAFATFVNSYNSLEPCERPRKVRAIRQMVPEKQRSMVYNLVKSLVYEEPLSDECVSSDLSPELLDSQPLSPQALGAQTELSNGYWHHISTSTAVCVPSSPDLGDMGNLEKDAVISDIFDFLNV